ncbi:MAG: CPBP family intramembrane glutamic endopeptidase, partial [Myxococcota bacterium]|nr:CPBP family intramembrane glutamic endopeptidase [Myxococcota bacterium]
ILPLALLYGLGLLVASPSARSGVDLISDELLVALGIRGYIITQLSLAVILIAYAAWTLRRRILRYAMLTGPVILEASIYGLVMGTLILSVMEQQHLLGPVMDPGDHLERFVVAAGAGLHEELVFRVILIPLLAWIGHRALAMPQPIAWAGAAIVSSLLFAGAHHLAGETFTHFAFAYRTFAGLIFAGVYMTRGFAVAAWTHAAYDLHVLYGTA